MDEREARIKETIDEIAADVRELRKFRYHHTLGGRFLLDPNEFNGWQVDGIYDQIVTSDLGNVGAAISRVAGGLVFPVPVIMTNFYLWHYQQVSTSMPWGFRIARQRKTHQSNAVSYVDLLRECTGAGATAVGPRQYGNTTTRLVDMTDEAGIGGVIPAGEVITFGVEAPTAETTNRYIYCQSGYLSFEEVLT